MHELSIAQEIINIVEASLPSRETKVKTIRLKVGLLSGVLIDSLIFCFEAITNQTKLENVKLDIVETPIKVKCNDCEKENVLLEPIFICPNCNSFNLNLIEGKELELVEIEIENPTEE